MPRTMPLSADGPIGGFEEADGGDGLRRHQQVSEARRERAENVRCVYAGVNEDPGGCGASPPQTFREGFRSRHKLL